MKRRDIILKRALEKISNEGQSSLCNSTDLLLNKSNILGESMNSGDVSYSQVNEVSSMSPPKSLDILAYYDGDDSDKDPDYIEHSESDSENEYFNLKKSRLNKKHVTIPTSDFDDTCSSFCYPENSEISNCHGTVINEIIEQEPEMNDSPPPNSGRPKRGRKRKFVEYTLAERKKRKYANLSYQGKSKEVTPKVFKDFACKCKSQCFSLVDIEIRRKEFEKFILLGSYEAQLLYIVSCVKESPKKRSYTSNSTKSGRKKQREFSRTYSIANIQVCRDMFVETLQISPQKITISLRKNRENSTLKDHRGEKSGGWNKTPEEDFNFVKNLINSLPKYESHYRRLQNCNALYLQPGMTMQKIYDLYVDEAKEKYGEEKKVLYFHTVRSIFLKNFNLRFKSLKKDTCNKCDSFAAKLKNNLTTEEKEALVFQRDNHLKAAEKLREEMNLDIKKAKEDSKLECITFDMEKTLPLPRIPTNIVFYKRQLWLYNCGIHVASDNQGYCCVWVEGEAGRGAQEVGSCLAKFIKINLKPTAEHLILWSDCCGGQNRNIKVVLILKAILASHPSLKSISLKFLESGHTFLPNDTDFGKIESHLKHFERVYTADDYIHIMKGCTKRNPLKIIKMSKEDFVGTSKLEKNITNRKVFTDKTKVNWLNTKYIYLKKEEMYNIFMKSFEEENFNTLSIEKKCRGRSYALSEDLFEPLWPNGKEIAEAKLNDLKSMFHLIPADCLDFYKKLKGNTNIIDDVDGFGGQLDFDLEV